MSPRARVLRWDAIPLEKATEMVARKTIAGAEIALVQSYLKKGTIVPLHAHAGERLIYVLQGALRAGLGTDDERTVREGEVLVFPVPSTYATPIPVIITNDIPVQTTLPRPENWQVWWSLFFDTEPPDF